MQQAILNNPIVALIVIIVPIVAIAWKVLDALYVKPRDFRITTLEKHVEQLRNELSKRSVEPLASSTLPPQVSEPQTRVQVQPSMRTQAPTPPVENEPLRSLESCYLAWKAEGQTELQVKHFEEKYIGQSVSWDVVIDSIDKAKYFISVYADSKTDERNDCRVCAHFQLQDETRLLQFRPKETVRLSGVIKEFFVFPVLEPVQIHKI